MKENIERGLFSCLSVDVIFLFMQIYFIWEYIVHVNDRETIDRIT